MPRRKHEVRVEVFEEDDKWYWVSVLLSSGDPLTVSAYGFDYAQEAVEAAKLAHACYMQKIEIVE